MSFGSQANYLVFSFIQLINVSFCFFKKFNDETVHTYFNPTYATASSCRVQTTHIGARQFIFHVLFSFFQLIDIFFFSLGSNSYNSETAHSYYFNAHAHLCREPQGENKYRDPEVFDDPMAF